jgi:lipopolysaccharide transport system ATP-binding protein
VVNAYQKLIYAPPAQQTGLAMAYKNQDQSPAAAAIEASESGITVRPDADMSTERPAVMASSQRNEAQEIESFDPRLVPDSRVIYPIQGAEIRSLRILDADGRNVNLLSFGGEYRFEISGKFLSNRESVFFGLHIRTISGLIVTGQRYPEEGMYVDKVLAGDEFSITYGFRMILSPDTYFSGCGIWSLDEPHCLHRILDAIMFRVLPGRKTKFLGYVDASATEPILDWKKKESDFIAP